MGTFPRMRVARALAGWALCAVLAGCGGGAASPSDHRTPHPGAASAAAGHAELTVATRQGRIGNFPCSKCHDKVAPDAGAREPGRGKHRDVRIKHFEGAQQCNLCHATGDRDHLRLVTQEEVGFDASHRLCGQCHGEKLRDWEIGAHGKHRGNFRDKRYRYTCTDCHNPHIPRPAPVRAMAAPPRPRLGIKKGTSHE